MKQPCRIELLGGLTIKQGDRLSTRFRTYKAGALLAYLAYHRERAQPREALLELLWSDFDVAAARNNLSTTLSSLRRHLEPPGVPPGAVLRADRFFAQLNPLALTTDVAAFDAAVREARQAPSEAERARHLSAAVDGYSGPLLPGYYEDWITGERERLGQAYLEALRWLARYREQTGDAPRALEFARRAATADPLDEEAHRNIMRLLAAAGQPAAALRQYRELERVLRHEMGEAPSPETRRLARDIEAEGNRENPSSAEHSTDAFLPQPDVSPPRAATPGDQSRLPLRLTRFFGREDEVTGLRDLLRSSPATARLVTVTGPGGTGKTRLALQAADALVAPLSGAVWFVGLVDLSEPRLIAGAIADALQLPRSPHVEPLEQVTQALARQTSLLILDNFERLAAGGAPLVWTLLTRVPTLTCLVTSRRRLHLPGEHEFVVGPLPTPPGSNDDAPPPLEQLAAVAGVQIFVDRAQAARPDFQITPRNAPAVAALCRALEGIPLALELAAARSTTLTPAQMLARLSERFSLLANQNRRRDGVGSDDPRHHSLWAALDWSFHLLPPPVRAFFARLSVFRGGWSLAAAEAVCEEPQATLEYLAQLRAHSLILAEESGAPAADLRFRMLETLREFASEQLSSEQRAVLAGRHAAHFLQMAEQAEPKLHGPEQITTLDRLEAEHDNLRAALTWSRDAAGDDQTHLRLAGALFWFWHLRGYWSEGRNWLERALAREAGQETTRARATALQGAGQLAYYLGDPAAARTRLEEAAAVWELLGDTRNHAYAQVYLCSAVGMLGEDAAARSMGKASVELARTAGDRWVLAMTLWMLGTWTHFRGDDEEARPLLEESVQLFRDIGDPWGLSAPLFYLARLTWRQGDTPAARTLFAQSEQLMRLVGDRWRLGLVFQMLAEIAITEGDFAQAQSCYEQEFSLFQALGNKGDIATAHFCLGNVARYRGEYVAARSHYEQALWLSQELGNQNSIAHALRDLGHTARLDRNWPEARSFYRQSLALSREGNDERGIAGVLDGLAAHLAAGDSPARQRAAQLFGMAQALRDAALGQVIVPPDEQPEHDAHVARLRDLLGEAAFDAAFAAGRALSWEQAVAQFLDEAWGQNG